MAGLLAVSSLQLDAAAGGLNNTILPAAGAARVLNEGVSITTIRAQHIRTTGQIEESYVAAVTTAAAEEVATEKAATEKAAAEKAATEKAAEEKAAEEKTSAEKASEKDSADEAASEIPEEKKQDEESVDEATEIPSAGAGDYESDDDDNKSSAGKKSSDKGASKDNKTVSSDNIEHINAGAGTVVEDFDAEDDDDNESSDEILDEEELDLVKAVKESQNEEEDFSNLVIAKVDNFVNVRTEPSEDSEVAGKLYNKSVGNELEVAGEWIKIKSGNTEGYVKAPYVIRGEEAAAMAKDVGTRTARVTTTTLYVREGPSKDSAVLGMVPMDDELTVLEETDDGWAKVSIEEGNGYVSTEFVHLYTDFVRAESKAEEEARLAREAAAREAARKAAEEAARRNAAKNAKKGKKSGKGGKSSGGSSSGGGGGGGYSASGSGNGAAVANYALQFVGNPYVYGGTSLTNGADCSGFVMSVYRNFGVSLPHSSGADRSVGSAVSGGLSNAQAGDIVCYSGHVGIYIGNGQIVHASTAKTGIKVSNAGYRSPVAVRRIF